MKKHTDGLQSTIAEDSVRQPASRRFTKQLMLVIKSGNLGLITFYSFAVIYVLARVIDPSFYPWIVFITSIGYYITASDLGFGGYVYAALRKDHLHGGIAARESFVVEALNTYFQIAMGSAVVAAIIIFATVDVAPTMQLAISAYFCTIVLSLPWSLIRRITQAIDRFVAIEVIELIRRAITLLLVGLMLAGLSFLYFALLSLLVWVGTFALGFWLIRREGMRLRLVTPRRALAFINENRRHVYSTSKVSGLEFILYNHPYVVLPFVTGDASSIVAYDIFYKFMRFGGVAYNVATDTYLPFQTRAYHAGDMRAVDRYRWITIGLEFIPFALCALFLIFFGERFVTMLLSSAHPIAPDMLYLVIAMLGLIMFQLTAGAIVSGVGQYDRLGRIATITVGLMALGSLATWLFGLNYLEFLMLFVGAYIFHTVMFQLAYRDCLRVRHRTAPLQDESLAQDPR